VAPHGIDLSSSSKLWPALITMGGAMMASTSPFPGVGLGQGVLAGYGTYAQQRHEEQAVAMNQQKMDLEVKKLNADLDYKRRHLDLLNEHYATERAKATRPIPMSDPDGTIHWRDPITLRDVEPPGPGGYSTPGGNPLLEPTPGAPPPPARGAPPPAAPGAPAAPPAGPAPHNPPVVLRRPLLALRRPPLPLLAPQRHRQERPQQS